MRWKKTLAGLLACLSVFGAAVPTAADTTASLMGDVNLNGAVDIGDAILLARFVAEDHTVVISAAGLANADINASGQTDASDVTGILRIIAKLEEQGGMHSRNLMSNLVAQTVSGKEADAAFCTAQTDFAVRLLQQAYVENEENGNVLISPLSILTALAMTANGAEGQTLAEMEQVLCGMPIAELNEYLYTQRTALAEKDALSMANAIWFREDYVLSPVPAFLQNNANYYGAGIYAAPFDELTRRDINGFVKENTREMIPEVLKEPISPTAVMFLVNALAFEADWMVPYSDYALSEGAFYAYDGTVCDVTMMHGEESHYLVDDHATGFIKPYAGGDYSFAVLLPNEGIDINDYVADLSAEHLRSVLTEGYQNYTTVYTQMPQFSYDDAWKMVDALSAMGMPTAFASRDEGPSPTGDYAEFGGMFEGAAPDAAYNVYIGDVWHKTHIDVDQMGTRAAAVTVVEMATDAAPLDPKQVTLDRPFVYMILDQETKTPVFIGTLMQPET